MVTTTTSRAAASFPAFQGVGMGQLCVAWGTYNFTTTPTNADIIELCRIPKNSVVLGGFLRMGDGDTGSAALDIDVGYAGATTAFGDFGVANGTAVTNYTPEGGSIFPLHGTLVTGPITLTTETVVIATVVATATTFAAFTITVVVWYVPAAT